MNVEEHLRAQDWKRLSAQLSAFAWKRTGRRSWDHANDLAQEAIAQAFTNMNAWDPRKEPLLKNLARRVIGLASNDLRRRRSSFECEIDAELADTLDDGKAGPDEALDQKRYSDAFRKRLGERIQGDETAAILVALMMDGIDEVADQIGATRLPAKKVAEARRRIYYHSEQVSKELARELDEEESQEVAS